MTTPLVASNDVDFTNFKAGNDQFFLTAAGNEVRKFCGWVISPPEVVSGRRCGIGRDGTIPLRTRYLTAVASVVVDGVVLRRPEDDPDTAQYSWDDGTGVSKSGVIALQGTWFNVCEAVVTYTHGYTTDTLPADIKAVVFELMTSAQEMPAGKMKSIRTLSFQYTLGDLGLVMSGAQMSRLVDYRVMVF